jgi:hypothetical protein
MRLQRNEQLPQLSLLLLRVVTMEQLVLHGHHSTTGIGGKKLFFISSMMKQK